MWFNVRGTVLRLFRFLIRTTWIAIWQFICGMYGDEPASTNSFEVGCRYSYMPYYLVWSSFKRRASGKSNRRCTLVDCYRWSAHLWTILYLLCVFVLYITTLLHLLGSHCLGVGCVSSALFISLVFTLSFYTWHTPFTFPLTIPCLSVRDFLKAAVGSIFTFIVLLRRQFQLH